MMGLRAKIEPAQQIARVGTAYLHDQIMRPKAESIAEVPASLSAVTANWLTEAVCGDSDARVLSFRHEPISAGSTSRARLYFEYAGPAGAVAALPPTVFVKSTSSFLTRLHVGATGAAGVEARFYREIQPTIDVRTPHGVFGTADRRTGRSILLLEDIARTRDVIFGDIQGNYIDRNRAESLVDTLAATHGSLYQSPRFKTDLRWMVTSLRLQYGLNRLVDFEHRTVVGFDRSADVMPPEIIPYRNKIHAYLMASVELDKQVPLGLVHSDVHAGNWFIEDCDRMGLFDWSIIAKGQGTRDLAYALMSNLTTEDRRSWEQELVERYTARLAEVSGVSHDPSAVWRSYRQQTMHGFCFWLYTIGRGTFQPKMQADEVSRANIQRMARAIMDLESFISLEI